MSVSGASSAFGRFQSLMKDLQGAVDARQGKNVTGPQADKIVSEFEQLKGAEKLAAATALKTFLQADVFQVTDAARGAFAKALGMDPDSLKPQAAAGGVTTNALKAGLKMIAGTPNVGAKELKELFGAMKNVPKEVGNFITSMMGAASKDGELNIGAEARPAYKKEVAERNQSGGVDYLANKFGDDFAARVPDYLKKMLSSPPLFEELIFLLMITLVSDTQKEVLEEQARIQKLVDTDAKTTKLKEDQQKAIDAGLAKKGTAANTAAEGNTPVDTNAMNAEAHRLGRTKAKFEGFVSAVDASLRDDGRIDAGESKALADKLDRTFPKGHPAREMVATAIGSAIEHSKLAKGGDMPDRLQPFMDFAKAATGKDTFPPPTKVDPQGDAGAALMGAIKPEQRLAGILVESLLEGGTLKNASAKETIKQYEPVLKEICSENPVGLADKGSIEAKVLARFKRIVELNEKVKAQSGGKKELDLDNGLKVAIGREMKDAPPEQQEMMATAVKKAFETLPKDGTATADDISKCWVEARGSLVADVMKDDPVVQNAEQQLVGSAVDQAIIATNGSVKNREDQGGGALGKEEKGMMLEQHLAVQRQDVVDRAKASGYTDAQAEAVGAVFDVRANQVRAKLEKSGKIEPENQNGMGKESTDPTESNDTRSRQIMFEQLKFKMNMLSEMMQSMSNILNTMHQNAENTIRAIR